MCFHALCIQKHYALLFILSWASAVAGLPLTARVMPLQEYCASTLMRAGGWDWAPSRRSPGTRQRHFAGTSFKPHKTPENAPRTHLSTARIVRQRNYLSWLTSVHQSVWLIVTIYNSLS